MTTKKTYFKIITAGIILLALIFPFAFNVGTLFASTEKLTIKLLRENYTEQEITNILPFLTDFEPEGEEETVDFTESKWKIPEYLEYVDGEEENILLNDGLSFSKEVNEEDGTYNMITAVNLNSNNTFKYGGDDPFTFKEKFGTGSDEDNYGLFFLTNSEGILGAETELEIPARAIYVLTFSAKVGYNSKSKGLNVKIIDGDNVHSMSKITNNAYNTYSFLIRGDSFQKKTITLQLLWGNITEKDGSYNVEKELGYAVVDTFQLFSVNTTQYEELASNDSNKKVDLFTISDWEFIQNGYFNRTTNTNWNLNDDTKIMAFLPEHWKQETVVTNEDSRVAHYGVVDVNSDRLKDILELKNPGSPSGYSSSGNNVLLLYNGGSLENQSSYQTITSTEFKLPKNSYYEISFKFNTPALMESAEEENNSLSFYVVNSEGKSIYAREDMFSYTEWTEDANEWATFRLFIKTPSTDQKAKFVIKFGTEENTKSGYAYVDEINRSLSKSEATLFKNSDENKYILKTEEGEEEIKHLEVGNVSFSDLEKLDFSDEKVSAIGENRSLAIYDYTAPIATDPEDKEEEEEEEEEEVKPPVASGNLSYLWYVIPSILLGLCVVLGLFMFYGRKLKSKIKLPKRHKKNSYDRRKTLNKQVSVREKDKNISIEKNNVEKELKSVKSQIAKLESTYQKAKSNPITLKSYIKKREKLQNQELRLKDKLDKK